MIPFVVCTLNVAPTLTYGLLWYVIGNRDFMVLREIMLHIPDGLYFTGTSPNSSVEKNPSLVHTIEPALQWIMVGLAAAPALVR